VVDVHVLDAVHQAGGDRIGPEAMAEPGVESFDARLDQERVGVRLAERRRVSRLAIAMLIAAAQHGADRRQVGPADPAAAATALRKLVTVCPPKRHLDVEKALRTRSLHSFDPTRVMPSAIMSQLLNSRETSGLQSFAD